MLDRSLTRDDFVVRRLGPPKYDSPLRLSTSKGDGRANYTTDDTHVLYNISGDGGAFDTSVYIDRGGPRQKLYFDPKQTTAAIVTCGGLSPGLNNVIRSLFLTLHYRYQVKRVIGYQYGFAGMNPANGYDVIDLTPSFVRYIHNEGGSALANSRGSEDTKLMVDTLERDGVNMFFLIGGDGTLRAAHAIAEEVERRGSDIAIVGIPKTIDNDVPFVYKTFGFDTAVGSVREALSSAHVEATGAPNGVGLVKVMGRDSGFIAAFGTLASMEVNFCLVPEIPFEIHGKGGLLELLEERLRASHHAVIIVAEGAGQEHFADTRRATDKSGNIIHKDIGLLLRAEISRHFSDGRITPTPVLKYIDPSYIIRSIRANASDAIFCHDLATTAVHAGMAGVTDVVIGLWHGVYVHLPIALVAGHRKKIRPESHLWRAVIGATGQPMYMTAEG